MGTIIYSFEGQYRFLSNFYPSAIDWYMEAQGSKDRWEGLAPTVEHAFQAAKAADFFDWQRILIASSPGNAKKMGRRIQLRSDWQEIKRGVMARALKLKFEIPSLAEKLMTTGDSTLVEGNTWHDNVWGNCYCGSRRCGNGENLLGIYLMNLREDLRSGKAGSNVR